MEKYLRIKWVWTRYASICLASSYSLQASCADHLPVCADGFIDNVSKATQRTLCARCGTKSANGQHNPEPFSPSTSACSSVQWSRFGIPCPCSSPEMRRLMPCTKDRLARGQTFIIAPATTLSNWARELKKFTFLETYSAYGEKASRAEPMNGSVWDEFAKDSRFGIYTIAL